MVQKTHKVVAAAQCEATDSHGRCPAAGSSGTVLCKRCVYVLPQGTSLILGNLRCCVEYCFVHHSRVDGDTIMDCHVLSVPCVSSQGHLTAVIAQRKEEAGEFDLLSAEAPQAVWPPERTAQFDPEASKVLTVKETSLAFMG